ncbi:MAG TPA: phenylacetate--CoA ligase PaaK [Burkholderiales bacterium]|nr:phenylacetate--CoA ligase PaaK [Burkholderiales bacterium]
MGHRRFAAGFDPHEFASRDEIRRLQLERLRATLGRAYERVPHYRAKFDASGVHAEDLRELADLAKFPFTTKDDLRANYPFGMFAVPLRKVVRIHASSGTTGRPTVVGYTQRDIDTWAELMARSIRAAGGGSTDVVHVAFGYGLFTGGLGVHYGAERLGATVVPMSGGQTERQVQLILDLTPTILMATPSYALAIADEFERQRRDPRDTTLRLGLFGAEPWTEGMRREIEARFAIDAIDLYGLSEVMGPGVAVECIEAKDGAQLWEDHFHPEVIDPETGRVLPDGEFGELVLTSLTKEALPVVRYRTRDLTRLLPGTARPGMRRMARITGRSDDMLIIRGVNVFPSQIEELILKAPALSAHYELEVSRPRHLDELEVHVEPKPEFAPAGEAAWSRAARELEHHIKSVVGVTARVVLVPPGAIERSGGKAKRVIDRRRG